MNAGPFFRTTGTILTAILLSGLCRSAHGIETDAELKTVREKATPRAPVPAAAFAR